MPCNQRETTPSLNLYERGKYSIRQSAPNVGVNCHKLRIYTIDNHSEVLLSSQKISKDVVMKRFWLTNFKCQPWAKFNLDHSILMFPTNNHFLVILKGWFPWSLCWLLYHILTLESTKKPFCCLVTLKPLHHVCFPFYTFTKSVISQKKMLDNLKNMPEGPKTGAWRPQIRSLTIIELMYLGSQKRFLKT